MRRAYAYAPRRRRRGTLRVRRIAVGRVPSSRYMYSGAPSMSSSGVSGGPSVGGRRRRRRARGGNFFRKIWRGVKSGANAVHDYAKRHRLVSRGLSLLPHPWAGHASSAAAALGYGARGGMYRISPGPYVMLT